jgi:hypothetical protein
MFSNVHDMILRYFDRFLPVAMTLRLPFRYHTVSVLRGRGYYFVLLFHYSFRVELFAVSSWAVERFNRIARKRLGLKFFI